MVKPDWGKTSMFASVDRSVSTTVTRNPLDDTKRGHVPVCKSEGG